MPATVANSVLFDAVEALKVQHGVYLFKLGVQHKPFTPTLTDPKGKENIILWFKANTPKYPKLADIETKGAAHTPLGGVQRACEAKLGTFGVYAINAAKKEAVLLYWVDFDHWPVEIDEEQGKFVGIKGLNTGHKHIKAKGFGNQYPVEKADITLYDELLKAID